ncbi:MAG: GH3 auxin-responsive promoter family protein, partial [Gemmatimonadetes bacterium]|nr:GH3 auxin-responsive promoter family protein [Gemmatimonadota bacterium]
QIHLVRDSAAGKRFLAAMTSDSFDEFRRKVPLTEYADYADLLDGGSPRRFQSDAHVWAYTATGPGLSKWIPYTSRAYERLLDNAMAALLLAVAERPGHVAVSPGDLVMYNVPSRPYLSGIAAFGLAERFGLRGLLDPATSEALDFRDRIAASFREALRTRVDIIVSLTSVLWKMASRFEQRSPRNAGTIPGAHPNARAICRLARAGVKSALSRRPVRPKDLWSPKAIVGWGLDTRLFSDRIEHAWGKAPYEMYAATEGGIMGLQPRDREGMVFSPYSAFYEFIPAEQLRKKQEDPSFRPDVLELDEVEAGKTYEVVITNFYGMPLLRYRLGHLIHIHAQGQNGPEFEFTGRSDERIDIAGFTRMDENTIWKALGDAGLPPSDWTARRERSGDRPVLHIYVEPPIPCDETSLAVRLHDSLKRTDPLYADLETMLGIRPLRVTVLPPGTFDRYYEALRKAGAPLTRCHPPRMNADDDTIDRLLQAAPLKLELAA